jgi:phthalate 4,5-dioxygenase oxygenase subunit
MLTPAENEKITRVGAGTPMGNLMRRYWQPAALSRELPENDGPPLRVRLLGEDLIAFRNSAGEIGLVDAFCPHRRAPMFFGRNEECGLRCVYHGWKFDISGACVDMPSEPPDSLFKTKVTIAAYPTWEGGGIVWTYMGPRDKQPAPPDYEWVRAPETHRFVSKTHEDANWLQGLEGGLDTAHSSFLHNEKLGDKSLLRSRDGHPRLEVEKSDYGFRYASLRDLGDDGLYARVYQYMMPWQQQRGSVTALNGGRNKVPKAAGHIWAPIDDTHTFVYNTLVSYDAEVPSPMRTRGKTRRASGAEKATCFPASGSRRIWPTITTSTGSCKRRRRTPESAASTPRTWRCKRGWARSATVRRNISGRAIARLLPRANSY